MPKATSVTPGLSEKTARKSGSTDRKAGKVVESARAEAQRLRAGAAADAARTRAQAEEHARRLILDARATADGVRAEGMELVSNLRQMSDALREISERVLEDVEAIHARMLGELTQVEPEPAGASEVSDTAEEELDVPEFVQPK